MPLKNGTIIYVGGFELPDKNAAAHRVLNNAKIFRELGYNVVFCGIDKSITSVGNVPNIVAGFKSYPLPYPNSNVQWFKQMLSIRGYLNIINKYDDVRLVICYNLHAVPLAKLIRVCKKRRIKIISDCTEWYGNNFTLHPIGLIKCIDTFFSMQVFQKKCDGMIAISNYLANFYKKYVNDIVTIPPLTDTEELFDKINISTTIQDSSCIKLIYSGSPSSSKESLGKVVDCLAKMADLNYRFVIVGIDYEQFCNMFNSHPDSSKIIFMGRVSHKEALRMVRESDYAIIIRPNNRITMAGFPTKFSEAISLSTAVIANDYSDLAHYVHDNMNGYLVDVDNLEDELRNIISNKPKPIVNSDIFDYHNWISEFRSFFKYIM